MACSKSDRSPTHLTVKNTKLISAYIMPFWPRPSWTTLCLNKQRGGIGLVDPSSQHLALHMIYIQRLLAPRPDDFVTQLLTESICFHTGHDTILPVIMFPKECKQLFKTIPTLEHLCSLLIKLPPLTPHPSWSTEWIMTAL